MVQRAIVHALQIVVDREAQEEELASQIDNVVDAGHSVDDSEDFNFDRNDVE